MNVEAAAAKKIPPDEMDGRLFDAPRRSRAISGGEARAVLVCFLRVADVAAVLAGGTLAYFLRYGTLQPRQEYCFLIVLGAVFAANALHLGAGYRTTSVGEWWSDIVHVAIRWAIAAMMVVGVAYFLKIADAISRAWLAEWAGLTLLGFVLARGAAAIQLQRWRRRGVALLSIAIVGIDGSGRRFARLLERTGRKDLQVVGVFEIDQRSGPAASRVVDDLSALSRRVRLDEIVIAHPTQVVPEHLLRRLSVLPADVRIWDEIPGRDERVLRDGEALAKVAAKVFERPVAGWNAVAKRAEDLVITTLALVLLSPLMLLIAAAIKLDSPGPVLFRQRRFGFNNEEFWVWKFRTMHAAAAADREAPQARRDDPRVTRFGALLRRTSLDELPQLFNVLRGEMSLVGPRPHPVPMNERYAALIDLYPARHRVRPGITGWAQVNGLRGETDTLEKMVRRLEHDLYYIDRWSLAFDLQIMLRTLVVGFVHRNAY